MAGTEPQRDGRDFALVPAAGLVALAASRPARPGPYLPPPPWLRRAAPARRPMEPDRQMPALRRADQTKPFRLTTAHVDKGAHSSARWMCRGDQRVPRHDNSGVSYAGVRLIQPDERYA